MLIRSQQSHPSWHLKSKPVHSKKTFTRSYRWVRNCKKAHINSNLNVTLAFWCHSHVRRESHSLFLSRMRLSVASWSPKCGIVPEVHQETGESESHCETVTM